MRLIDADQLKKEWSMGDICETCVQDTRHCHYNYCFSRMDVCGMIDDAPTVGGWISVKDRLPKDDQDVLAFLSDGEETRTAACNYSNGVWYDCVMNCIVVLQNVTHWMPLPKPPKEDKP